MGYQKERNVKKRHFVVLGQRWETFSYWKPIYIRQRKRRLHNWKTQERSVITLINPGFINFCPYKAIFFFFRPFPSIRGSHSVLSFSKPSYFQRPSPSHQLPPYLLSLYLKIFSLVSLFSSFPVIPFPSSLFLHTLGLSS